MGLQVNWEKIKLSPVQCIPFLGVELDFVKKKTVLIPYKIFPEASRTHGILSHGNVVWVDANKTTSALAQSQDVHGTVTHIVWPSC